MTVTAKVINEVKDWEVETDRVAFGLGVLCSKALIGNIHQTLNQRYIPLTMRSKTVKTLDVDHYLEV